MVTILKSIANIVNTIHDGIITVCDVLGLEYTDKMLHFWIIGVVGIIIFFLADITLKH